MTNGERGTARGATEIPERVFRRSEDYRHLASLKAERRRQTRAELRARWPASRILRTAAVWIAPWAALGLLFWVSGAWGGVGAEAGGR